MKFHNLPNYLLLKTSNISDYILEPAGGFEPSTY
jgi:hypothetical protein